MNRMQNYRCTTCRQLADEELCGSPCRQCAAAEASGQAALDRAETLARVEQDRLDDITEVDCRDHLDRFGREFSADELVETGGWS